MRITEGVVMPQYEMGKEGELIASIAKNRPAEVKALLEQGINVNWQEESTGCSPIHFAITMKRYEIMDLLLAHSANVNIRDNEGKTPLHWAVKESNLPAVERLLKAGARANCRDNEEKRPSYYSESREITECLTVAEKEEQLISKAARALATVKNNRDEKGSPHFFHIPQRLAIKIASHCAMNLNAETATHIAKDNYQIASDNYRPMLDDDKLILKPN